MIGTPSCWKALRNMGVSENGRRGGGGINVGVSENGGWGGYSFLGSSFKRTCSISVYIRLHPVFGKPPSEVGFIFLVSPKGHPVYTLTSFTKGTLYTLTKNSNMYPTSLDPGVT